MCFLYFQNRRAFFISGTVHTVVNVLSLFSEQTCFLYLFRDSAYSCKCALFISSKNVDDLVHHVAKKKIPHVDAQGKR